MTKSIIERLNALEYPQNTHSTDFDKNYDDLIFRLERIELFLHDEVEFLVLEYNPKNSSGKVYLKSKL